MIGTTATTQHYLNIADIRDDTLILKNGEVRQVLEVTSVNFALKSDQEQSAIVYQYQAFLNSLQFAIQIVIQSRQLDLTKYLASLQNHIDQSPLTPLRAQTLDYLDFVSRLVSLGSIMEKRFFVIVPYASATVKTRNVLAQLLKRETVHIDEKVFSEIKEKIAERTDSIRQGLGGLGLTVTPLTSKQIAELLFRTYNPIEAGEIAVSPVDETEEPRPKKQ